MAKTTTRKLRSYPTAVSDEEGVFCVPYLTLMSEAAPQREHSLRTSFNALRWLVRARGPWRSPPPALRRWAAGDQQTLRWIRAGCFEVMAHDLRTVLRELSERASQPTAVILDGRTLQSTPESGARAGYDGHKRRKGSKVHMAVDTLGHLLALVVTPANKQERAQLGALTLAVQQVTGGSVELAYVDQGYTGDEPQQVAQGHGMRLEVVQLPEAKRGFVLLPRRWVVERSFAWTTRFRRLVRDYERLPQTVAGLHFIAFACLMLHRIALAHGP